MFQSTPLSTTTSQLPLRVTFDPASIMNQESYATPRVVYDPETGVLTFKQDPALAGQPVQFVFPIATGGHTVEVDIESVGVVVAQNAELVLPPLTMYQQHSAEIGFTPPPSAALPRPTKPKFKTIIRVRPTGGG